jgi:Polyketide cyclase / dehydrase and lipid transport
MTTFTAISAVDLAVDPDTVWKLIGGFGSLRDWLTNFATSELGSGGRTRRLTTTTGDVIVEQLVAFDEAARSYSYAILQSPFPVSVPLSTVRVLPQPDGPGSRVEWSGHFTPRGVSESQAAQLVQQIYDDGLASLVEHYASKTPLPELATEKGNVSTKV